MSTPLEDYALIGDCQSAALVSREGSIDWLCWPRFDSDACFSALLGEPKHGRWLITPAEPVLRTTRRYRPGTLVLETRHETAGGVVLVVDFMPVRGERAELVRLVIGERGQVRVKLELVLRPGFGSAVPWVHRVGDTIEAVAGPDLFQLTTVMKTEGRGLTTVGELSIQAGQRVPFVLSWCPSHVAPPQQHLNAEQALCDTESYWLEWSSRFRLDSPYVEHARRSLITLKALTFAPTGGIVAAPTTSLPEALGGERNWDYRFCWIRDATFTLYALMSCGFRGEADSWRRWLLRAVAGAPAQLQALYGIAGERRLPEVDLDWLPGYENSRPVRIGNAAALQLQLDVWGELMDTLHLARQSALPSDIEDWPVQRALVEYLETLWQEPDEGIWEIRGPRRHFTHSKVMAWVALDRAVKAVEEHGLTGPAPRWRVCRDAIHAAVCEQGYDPSRGTFVQYFGSTEVDASLLLLPLVGFLPPEDPRIAGTVRAVEQDLAEDGLVLRYRPRSSLDGLEAREGFFLPCSFWLVDNYVLQGEVEAARALLDRLLSLSNDLGLLSEEYDRGQGRLVGNFPQAFSHVSLINSVLTLHRATQRQP